MRFSVNARLTELAYDALLDVAERDFRDPREQATKLIVDGLRAAGALPDASAPSLAEANDRTAVTAGA